METFDFEGWATKPNLKCSDGRIIENDAFKHQDGQKVPLVWGHCHDDPLRVLGHAMLESRDGGIWAYGFFNDSEQGQNAKLLVEHGDVTAMSIYVNKLQQNGPYVKHGVIREVSLVLAGANPGASIQNIIKHSDDGSEEPIVVDDEARIYTGEQISLSHSSDDEGSEEEPELEHADDGTKEEKEVAEETQNKEGEETIADVFNTLTEKQKTVVYAMIGQALEEGGNSDNVKHEDSEGGNDTMEHNIFEKKTEQKDVLSHSDQESIIALAKQNNVGSLQTALQIYADENSDAMAHAAFSNSDIETLFPDYKDVRPGTPETLERDQSWVAQVMRSTHKSPISRIRTRQFDARVDDLRAHGYGAKGSEKKAGGNVKLLKRTTDPQTIYRKDTMHRDDIIDITDFDVVAYQWSLMRRNLEEEIARAIMIGDGRDEGDEAKISEEHIRSIWNDDELYTIHADVDIEAARTELQGLNTGANFGDNYIYAESIISAALYSREKYKGSGALAFYCTPHLLNVMLLARDLNGRRIYSSKADLAAALNVTAIYTVEQFEGLVRTDKEQKKHKLLGIFVNLADYQIGCTKGGEITKFDQFDIDFNSYKYLIETRISGALTRVYSAIVLEEPVTEGAGAGGAGAGGIGG